MAVTVVTNAFLIDGTGKEPADGAAVVIEGERIKDLRVFQNPDNLHLIMMGGAIYKRAF